MTKTPIRVVRLEGTVTKGHCTIQGTVSCNEVTCVGHGHSGASCRKKGEIKRRFLLVIQ